MGAQQDVTQVLDLGLAPDQQPQAMAGAIVQPPTVPGFNQSFGTGTGAFAAGATGFNAVNTGMLLKQGHAPLSLKDKLEANRMMVILGSIVLGLGAFFFLGPYTTDDVLNLLGMGEPQFQAPVPRKPQNDVVSKPNSDVPSPPSETPSNGGSADKSASTEKSDSVWSNVENELGTDLPELGAQLTSDQDAMLREKLSHRFNYQRYVGVTELAALRARGSEDLLRTGLESKKFWTRMRALIGLADLGAEITDEDVKMALGDAHSELRARFFKRFEKSPCTVGCFYVARAALPHLDELGRAQVIQVISRESADVRDVFMVAATFDKSEMVRSAAEAWLSQNSVDPSIRGEVKASMGQ